MITLKELKNKEPTWYDIAAAPSGKIISKEEYNYMLSYSKFFHLNFYWTDNDRHIPTYEECYNKYLRLIDFFGGAAFYFTVSKKGNEWINNEFIGTDWSYGKYGKIKEIQNEV